mmetsp:Transcript_16370/g.18203  ORF Transcript_16370/g.18203 Transcript_16370/m.18203 type:complete len:106 (+) Transcript_16370:254-571(+)
METTLESIADYEQRGKFDKTFVEGYVVDELGLNGRLEYQRVNPGTFLSDRDLLFATRKFTLDDGRVVWAAASVDDDSKPPLKKIVRAEMHIGGWILEENDEDPDK